MGEGGLEEVGGGKSGECKGVRGKGVREGEGLDIGKEREVEVREKILMDIIPHCLLLLTAIYFTFTEIIHTNYAWQHDRTQL